MIIQEILQFSIWNYKATTTTFPASSIRILHIFEVCEDFIGLYEVDKADAKHLSRIILDCLTRLSLVSLWIYSAGKAMMVQQLFQVFVMALHQK